LSKIEEIELVRLGTEYGGWFVPRNSLRQTHMNKFLISAGIGHDVSFDVEMQNNGFAVIALDPLIECCRFAEEKLRVNAFTKVLNVGLGKRNGRELLFSPASNQSNSWSLTNEHGTSFNLAVPIETITISEILKQIPNTSKSYIVLKLDIEGAERIIFQDIIDCSESFDYICIELDFLQLLPFKKLIERIKRVRETRLILKSIESKGFRLIHVENFNFFWIRDAQRLTQKDNRA
jgi:FkbM family methyltransferase